MKKKFLFLLLSVFMFAYGYSAFVTTESKGTTEEVSSNPNTDEGVPSMDAVKSAMKEFKTLSKHERKDRIKEAKKQLKQMKANKEAGAPTTDTTLLVIVAILLPPLAVYLHEGTANGKFWLSVLLWLLFYIPGLIYALIVILGD